MKKVEPTDLKPCPHMRALVSAHVDHSLRGIQALYTEFHIKGCPQCKASIPFLQSLKSRLVVLHSEESDPAVFGALREDIDRSLSEMDAQ